MRKKGLVYFTNILISITTLSAICTSSFSSSSSGDYAETTAFVENCNIADDSFLDRPVSESKYSSRDLGYITSGKRQGSDKFKGILYSGNCWAYALNAAAEASLKKFYPDVYKDKEPDLSEAELAGQIWTVNTDPLGLIKIDHSTENFWGTAHNGGYFPAQAIFDLATGADLADEDNDDDVFYDSIATLTDAFNLKSAKGNTNRIKNIIKEYGAAVVGISARDSKTGKVYLNNNNALYVSDKTSANHSVALVGWDDSLPSDFFTNADGQKPSQDGGWIAKNSNASDGILTEDSYYFYISYEDSVLLSNEVTAVKCEPLLSEYNEYQYDESSYHHASSRVLYASNIFTLSANKDGHETIDRVAFFADAGQYTVDIYNYGNNTDAPWNVDGLSPISSETVEMPFMQYKVFSIDPITLNYGDRIAIVIHRTDNSEFTIAYSGNSNNFKGASFTKGYLYLDDGTGRFNKEKYIYDKEYVGKGIPRIKMFTTSNLDGERASKELRSVTVNNENDLEFNAEFKKVSPEISVYDEKGNLVPHRYYTVEYDDLVTAGTHTVTVTGDGDHYTGSVSTKFTIKPLDLNKLFETQYGMHYIASPLYSYQAVYSKNATYTAGAYYAYKISGKQVTLERGKDFTDTFVNLEGNKVQYTITGKGNFTGTLTNSETVKNANISPAKVALSQNSYVYTGSPVEPDPSVSLNDDVLEEGIDYTISYSDNTEIGTATITITGMGHYEGTVSKSFQISQSVPSDEPTGNDDIPGSNDDPDPTDENNEPIVSPVDDNPSTPEPESPASDTLSDNMVSVVVGSATITYPKEITFSNGKKAAFNTGDVTITDSDGSKRSYKSVKVSRCTKTGSTSFKIKSPSGDKATAKLIKKYKFPVTIVPYEVSSKDSVTVKMNSKGVLKSVLVNGIKLKKNEFSGTEDSLTFSGRFTGSWSK